MAASACRSARPSSSKSRPATTFLHDRRCAAICDIVMLRSGADGGELRPGRTIESSRIAVVDRGVPRRYGAGPGRGWLPLRVRGLPGGDVAAASPSWAVTKLGRPQEKGGKAMNAFPKSEWASLRRTRERSPLVPLRRVFLGRRRRACDCNSVWSLRGKEGCVREQRAAFFIAVPIRWRRRENSFTSSSLSSY